MKVLLINVRSKRTKTNTQTSFSGMFVEYPNDDKNAALGETEKRCLEMLRMENCTWVCGCVTVVPEPCFSGLDKALLAKNEMYKTFDYGDF